MSDVSQPAAIRSNLLLLQQTQRQIDKTQTRLATGLKINSALDGPQSFFAAKGLNQRASDLLGLKDAMGQAISTINAADQAVSSIQELIDQARGLTESALQNSGSDPQSVATRKQLANDFNQIVQAIDDLARDSGYGGRNLAIGDGTVIAADGAGRGQINQIVGLDGTTVTNVAAADTYSVAVSGTGAISGNINDMASAETQRGLENLRVYGTQDANGGTYDSISIRVEGGAGQDKTITVSDGTNTRAIQISANGSDNGTYVFNFSDSDDFNGVPLDDGGKTVVNGDMTSNTGVIIEFTVDVASIEGVAQTSGVGTSTIEKFVDHQVTVSNSSGESITRDAGRTVGTGRLNNGENAFAFNNGTVRVNVDSAQLQVSAEATQASLGNFTGPDAAAVSSFISGITQTGLTENATLSFTIEETRAAAAQEAGQLSAVNSQGNTINSVATLAAANTIVAPNTSTEFSITLDGETVTVDTSGFTATMADFASELQDALRAADGNSANLSVAVDGNNLVISDSLGRGMRDGVLAAADPDDNVTATFSTGAALGGQMTNLTADVPVNDERTYAFRVVTQTAQAADNLQESGGVAVMDTAGITAFTHSADTAYSVVAFNDGVNTEIRLRSEDGSFDVTQSFLTADLDGTNIHDFTDASGQTVSITFDAANIAAVPSVDADITGDNARMGFDAAGGAIEDGAGAPFDPAGILNPAETQPVTFTLTLDSTNQAFGTAWAAAGDLDTDAATVNTFSITVDGQTFTSGAAGNTDLEGVAQGIRNQLAGQDGFQGVEVLVETNTAGDERLVVRTTDGSVLNNFELRDGGGAALANNFATLQGGTYTLTDSYGNSATTFGFDGEDLDFVDFGNATDYVAAFDISFTTVDLSGAVAGETATFTMTPGGAYASSFDIEAGETIIEVSDGTGPAVRLTNAEGGENLAGLNTQASATVNGVEVSFELLDSAQVQPGGRVAQTVTGETTTELSITVSDGTNTGTLSNVTSQFAGGEVELGDATLALAFNRANINDAGAASRAESSITNVYSVMGTGTNGAIAAGNLGNLTFSLGEQEFSVNLSAATTLTMASTINDAVQSQAQAAGFDASGVSFSFANGTLTMTDEQGRGFSDVAIAATAAGASGGTAVTTAEGRPAGLNASVEVTQGEEISRDMATRTIVGGTSNNDLFVTFNERRTSVIQVQAINLQTDGTGLRIDRAANGWQDVADIERSVAALDNATNALRSASSSFSTALNIVTARETFTEQFSNVLQEGADKLVLADPNQEGANMLTLQTRQQLGTISLSIANQSQQAILRLF